MRRVLVDTGGFVELLVAEDLAAVTCSNSFTAPHKLPAPEPLPALGLGGRRLVWIVREPRLQYG